MVSDWCQLDEIILAAARAQPLPASAGPVPLPTQREIKRTIAVAYDEAFHFYYEDNLARLESAGARLIRFSPIHDAPLPVVEGLYLGGGYPEAHAAELADNAPMRRQIAAFAATGGAIYAECGGLIYLCSELLTLGGGLYPMCGVLPARTVMCDRLQALGYRRSPDTARFYFRSGRLRFRGHQFRYSAVESLSNEIEPAFMIRRRRDGALLEEGFQIRNVIASYVHAHWASNPAMAEAMVQACARASPEKRQERRFHTVDGDKEEDKW